jgi:lysyl-tRNA synthetase class 2
MNERGSRHIPEFTLLEWYRTNSSYEDLMKDCENLLLHISEDCFSATSIGYKSKPIVLNKGLVRVSVHEAFEAYCDISMNDAVMNGNFDEQMVVNIEPALMRDKPVLLMDYPIEMAALARPKHGNPQLAERFELYAGGLELANGFSELTDPVEQRKRFAEANSKREKMGYPPLPCPEPFLQDLPLMPPSAGIALGIDRLVMLFTDAGLIDDVLAFTPEEL